MRDASTRNSATSCRDGDLDPLEVGNSANAQQSHTYSSKEAVTGAHGSVRPRRISDSSALIAEKSGRAYSIRSATAPSIVSSSNRTDLSCGPVAICFDCSSDPAAATPFMTLDLSLSTGECSASKPSTLASCWPRDPYYLRRDVA